MHLVENGIKVAPKKKVAPSRQDPRPSVNQRQDLAPSGEGRCINAAISLLDNIVETACEREPDLDLMRFVNLLDLYKMYLRLACQKEVDLDLHLSSVDRPSYGVLTPTLGDTELLSFESFVRDSQLLSLAATALSRETGEKIAAPAPLAVSANS